MLRTRMPKGKHYLVHSMHRKSSGEPAALVRDLVQRQTGRRHELQSHDGDPTQPFGRPHLQNMVSLILLIMILHSNGRTGEPSIRYRPAE